MEWNEIVTLVLTILSVPTIAGLLWKDIYERKKKKHEHVCNLQDNADRETLRSVIKDEIRGIDKKVDSIAEKMDKVGAGTLSSLRNDILTCYYRCREKGYRNDYDYQNIYDLYEAYEGLNGNSFVKDIMKRFDSLPTKEQYRLQNNKGGIDDGEE